MGTRHWIAVGAIALATTAPVPARAGEATEAATGFSISRTRIDAALEKMVRDGRAAGVSVLLW